MLSLLSALAVAALWVRSYAHWEEIQFSARTWDVTAIAWRGRAELKLMTWYSPPGQPSGRYYIVQLAALGDLSISYLRLAADPGADFDDPRFPPVWRVGRFSYAHDDWSGIWHGRSVRFPMWAAVVLFSVLPLRWFWRGREVRRWRARGLCLTCGYDPRGTPDRCPECGDPVAANITPAGARS